MLNELQERATYTDGDYMNPKKRARKKGNIRLYVKMGRGNILALFFSNTIETAPDGSEIPLKEHRDDSLAEHAATLTAPPRL